MEVRTARERSVTKHVDNLLATRPAMIKLYSFLFSLVSLLLDF